MTMWARDSVTLGANLETAKEQTKLLEVYAKATPTHPALGICHTLQKALSDAEGTYAVLDREGVRLQNEVSRLNGELCTLREEHRLLDQHYREVTVGTMNTAAKLILGKGSNPGTSKKRHAPPAEVGNIVVAKAGGGKKARLKDVTDSEPALDPQERAKRVDLLLSNKNQKNRDEGLKNSQELRLDTMRTFLTRNFKGNKTLKTIVDNPPKDERAALITFWAGRY